MNCLTKLPDILSGASSVNRFTYSPYFQGHSTRQTIQIGLPYGHDGPTYTSKILHLVKNLGLKLNWIAVYVVDDKDGRLLVTREEAQEHTKVFVESVPFGITLLIDFESPIAYSWVR